MRFAFPVVFLALFTLTACARKEEAVSPERHYQLSGKIVALNAKDQTATVDAAAIPNFMEAMSMEYPIKSKAEFNSLHVGDKISATVDARDDGYDLSDVRKQK